VNQPSYSAGRSSSTSKKRLWTASVTDPFAPSPTVTPSTVLMGVTSAAVPVKKSSSAVYSSPREPVASSWTV
jgi:hypothetical protein